MKRKLTIIGCLIGLCANAQYFETLYGTAAQEEIGSGMVTNMVGPGHVMSGRRLTGTSAEIVLVRTDMNGLSTALPYFKNRYPMYDNSTLSIQFGILQTRVLELNNNMFGVVGTCIIDPSTNAQAIYYSTMDASGNPLFSNYYLNGNTYVSYEINGARIANSGNEFYMTGMAYDGTEYFLVVMKIDIATGNPVWNYVYRVQPGAINGYVSGFDLVENPLTNELLVVGQRNDLSTPSGDGFVMHLDPNNGNPLFTDYYGDPVAYDAFTSIALAASGIGYYVGGWTEQTGVKDQWVMLLNNANNPIWSNTYDHDNAGQVNYGLDLIERINTAGIPVVYSMGRATPGVIGLNDTEVFEIDGNTGTCWQQFTYGMGSDDWSTSIDQNNSGIGGDGISVYGMRDGGSTLYNLIIFKAYFNGVTPCDYDIRQIATTPGPGIITNYPPMIVDKFYPVPNYIQLVGKIKETTICYAQGMASGSNAIQPIQTGITNHIDVDIYVPESMHLADYQLRISSTESGSLESELRDVNGKLIHRFETRQIEAGESVLPLDLSTFNVPTGVYFLQWKNGDQLGSEKVIIH